MEEPRSEFLNELVGENANFSEEEFCARLKEYVERRDRAVWLHFSDRFIYVGVDINIYVLPAGGWI